MKFRFVIGELLSGEYLSGSTKLNVAAECTAIETFDDIRLWSASLIPRKSCTTSPTTGTIFLLKFGCVALNTSNTWQEQTSINQNSQYIASV
jgi:hypothetical protein